MKIIIYPWLIDAWNQLDAMRSRLPHALLLSGAPGIGKRVLAESFGQSLLCEANTPGGDACGVCGACHWFAEGNHPDYRLVIPEILQAETELRNDGADTIQADNGGAKSKSAPSKVIKIGQIRALDGFFSVGTHRAGRRVVLVYPADCLNVDASSALLKTLEEPPPDTHFLLVTSRPYELLPTIRSRCAKVVIAPPPRAPMLDWLAAQGVKDPAGALAEAGEAPLSAVTDQSGAAARSILIDALSSDAAMDPVSLAEKCEMAGIPSLTLWLTRWVGDILRCAGGGDVRYHPRERKVLVKRAAHMHPGQLHAYYRRLTRMRRVADHPLNARLVAEDLLIDYARLAGTPNKNA